MTRLLLVLGSVVALSAGWWGNKKTPPPLAARAFPLNCWIHLGLLVDGVWTSDETRDRVSKQFPLTEVAGAQGSVFNGRTSWQLKRGDYTMDLYAAHVPGSNGLSLTQILLKRPASMPEVEVARVDHVYDLSGPPTDKDGFIVDAPMLNSEIWSHFKTGVAGSEEEESRILPMLAELQARKLLPAYLPSRLDVSCFVKFPNY